MTYTSDSVNTAFVLDMQRKLYRWTTAKPDKVFADLFNLVCDRRTLSAAWQRMARNRGSQTPGTDGITRRMVETRSGGVDAYLESIRIALRSGSYKPEPVRQRLIPKAGRRRQFRPLGIPTLTDRLVQMALKLILEPIFEADFYPTSYGFRKGRSPHDALAKIQKCLHPTCGGKSVYSYVIEGDIKGCFDAIDHHILMNRLRLRISDRKVLRLIKAYLKAGVMVEGTVRHPVTGSPQGGMLSPLLANVYLTALDERYGRWSGKPRERPQNGADRRFYDRSKNRQIFFMVRYADDFVILVCGTREQAEAEKQNLAAFLKTELRMDLSDEKTMVTDVREGFDFLGYRVAQTKAHIPDKHGHPRYVGNLFIPKRKLADMRYKIKVLLKALPTGYTLSDVIGRLNPILLGWRNYYRYATLACRDFFRLDNWIRMRVYRWLKKKYRKASWRTLRYRFMGKTRGNRYRWCEGTAQLRLLREGGTTHYPHRGIRIPNGWNAENYERFTKGAKNFWPAINTLARW